jgi:BMFP domain-containing protein YqiC
MIRKGIRIAVIATVVTLLVGGVLFGRDLFSYMRSGARSVRATVKDQIPTEFELSRARDLLEDIIPEMQANIRLMAQEEVEIAALTKDIEATDERLAHERVKIDRLTELLSEDRPSYTISGRDFSREMVRTDLARRFDRFKEAQQVLAGKQRLLTTRENSLDAAIQMLDRTRGQKQLLGERVAALEAQHRMIQAAAVGSKIELDQTRLAQADRLIHDLKKRLDVAERVLACEARFTESIEVTVLDEADLLTQIREHFAEAPTTPGEALAATP